MAIKLSANYSKKLGLPNYSSHSFSASVEVELTDISQVEQEVQGREQVQVSLEPLQIRQFISGGFSPMNELCERAGMSESQISERTRAVFGYFNLPFDVPPPR